MLRVCLRILALVVVMGMFASTGSAYYFYVHYGSRSGPFSPVYEKFDLNALQNNTVYFYISDSGPSGMAPGDSFPAIVSEIRTAAQQWNNVPTSLIRLAYGGLYTAGSGQVNSGITVEFSNDLAPGVIALGGPITFSGGSNGQFVPIQRATIRMQSDLSQPSTACGNNACPSSSEYFFTTLVHEFGHTLGLQHTFTSACMSTYVTSAATKAAPLAADDIMGISLLYPAPGFLSSVGTITGRVTANGSGVSMASVVAISPSNQAISTITNPDGTYVLSVPPNAWEVYAHPIPPQLQTESSPGNLVWPRDGNGNPLPFPTSAFQTQFYPGTQEFLKAAAVYVNPASANSGINFTVKSKPSVTIGSVRTYGYSRTNVPIPSPPIAISSRASMVASGAGLLQNSNSLAPGLNISVIGSGSNAAAQVYNVQPWTAGYLEMAVAVGYFAEGSKHMLFSAADDIYVLPSAFHVVSQDAPSITSISSTATLDPNGNKVLAVNGTNLLAGSTAILFDGLPASQVGVAGDGSLLVVAPPAPGSYRAIVTALNPDGQSSNFLQAPAPPSYTYDPSPVPTISVSPTILSPGDNVVDVVGVNTNFIAGQVAVGFGTSDVVVNSVTVLGPNHLSISVTSNGSISTSAINITNGISLIAQSQGSPVNPQYEKPH